LEEAVKITKEKNKDLEEEIKKQNGTIEELKTSFILEHERLEKNIEELTNASLYFLRLD
jgi:hypothetical protein